jgi:transposase
MRPVSIDLRKRVIAAYEGEGQSMGQIAQRFAMAKGTVQNIIEHYRATGGVAPKPQNPGRKPAFQGEVLARLEADVDRHPDATLEELRDRSGLRVSLVAVHNTLKRLGFTRRKSLYVRMSSAGPT